MNSTATTTLQYYTPGVYSVLTNVALSAFLFGESTLSLSVSICKSSHGSRVPDGALHGVGPPLDVSATASKSDQDRGLISRSI